MQLDSKIFLAGHKGMVGSALLRLLQEKGYRTIITRTRSELDLTSQQAVEDFFATERPDYVFLAAAKVGGIMANETYPAEFIYENLVIATNIIHSAWKHNVKKLLNLGSSCIYPKFSKQPIKEEYLLTDELEPTNEAYALAKIAALKLCHYYNKQYGTHYISVMPSNLYGIGDNFHYENSHALPAMIRKFHDAKIQGKDSVTLWGDGSAEREFLFVDDLAQCMMFLMEDISAEDTGELINVGYGSDIRIKALAELVKKEVGFMGSVVWDTSMPNGTPKKLMDSQRIHTLGWSASTTLEEGIAQSYTWFCEHYDEVRK